MFVHQSQLRHLLQPDQYTSEDQYRAELEHLFQPAWHPVATTADLRRPGDFLTFTLFETPVLLRNVDGRLCGFLNVCPHRHSLLTSQPRGHSPRFACQYHGWEYAADGRTAKIPDARVFRPWDRENACLRTFPVETCGEIVFVKLTDGGPNLREFVGPLWNGWAAGFAAPFRFAAAWEKDFACNWKVVLENSLESYHIPQVHPKTFKTFPDEPDVEHVLDPRYSTFTTPVPQDFHGRAQSWIVRRLGRPVTARYWHQVLHPHVTVNTLDVHRMIQCVFPTGPASCRYRSIMFTLHGAGRGPLSWALSRFLKSMGVMIGRKLFNEDAAIYETVQRGLAASPHRGVIGTREERIYAFQKYVLDACGQSAGPDPAGGCPAVCSQAGNHVPCPHDV